MTDQRIIDAQQLIQDDLLTYCDGMEDRVLTEMCDIIVKRFKPLMEIESSRKVDIDSMLHYALQCDPENTDKLLFMEYGTGDPEDVSEYDACPRMGHREPFEPHEGRVIERFTEGERVEFVYSSFGSKITAALADGKVRCGDDLGYHLCVKEETPPEGEWHPGVC